MATRGGDAVLSIMDGANPGQVTIADLFRVMSNIQTDLAKAVIRLEVIDVRNVNAEKKDDDFEIRIRALEAFKYKLLGFSSLLAILAGIISGYLSSKGLL